MEAKLGNSPSFIWRSIAEARRVISSGSNWRIGTGKDTAILGQPWLDNLEDPYISTISPSHHLWEIKQSHRYFRQAPRIGIWM